MSSDDVYLEWSNETFVHDKEVSVGDIQNIKKEVDSCCVCLENLNESGEEIYAIDSCAQHFVCEHCVSMMVMASSPVQFKCPVCRCNGIFSKIANW